ncbi:transcriptional repressor [Thauera sinica]|uniref:Transcriptional repressor n=1 Tax=Thauera sinica TaxID=2665146 RepID=A0ABW1ASB1_9RHOO|nr:transcriptional repressor [Thauera sp. K11]ATE61434.1 hypothetical protein CCZ27_17065 [Thauera sp. K11]
MTEISERFRDSGLAVTNCRLWIMESLIAAPGMRSTVESLFEALRHRGRRLSLSTVYAALRVMEAHHLVGRDLDGKKIIYWVPCTAAAGTLRFICRYCKAETTIHERTLHEALYRSAAEHGVAIGPNAPTLLITCQQCADRRPGVHKERRPPLPSR